MIRRNTSSGNIQPDKFREILGKAKQFLKRQYDEEGDENTLSESRLTESSGSGYHGTLPVKSTSPRRSYQQESAKQVHRRRRSGLEEVSKPSSDTNAPGRTSRSNERG